MVNFFRSINFKLIMLILGLALIQNSYILYQSLRQADMRIEEEAKDDLVFNLKHMQDSLRYLVEQKDYLEVQKEFISLGLDPHMQLGLLLDDKDNVIASLHRADIGKSWSQVLSTSSIGLEQIGRLQQRFNKTRFERNGNLEKIQDGDLIEGIYSIILGTSTGSLRPDQIGILILQQDLASLKQEARMGLLQHSIGAVFVILISALIILALLTYWVVHPLNKLNVAAQHLTHGEWDHAHTLPLERSDEVGALARAFAGMTRQLKEAFDTLENKVKKRTSELEQANMEIIKLNERLSVENIRMGTELEVTRKLQQMVLPHASELSKIHELDIACFMEPASEVGGDYYDVLQHDGHIKIGIGDVTGHGLESGVLMLMVQTAVRTLLLNDVSDSRTFMNILNRTIYDNVQRMRSDKNLTLSILDYQKGTLSITGQHEEVLLVKKNGSVERIDTFDLGFMVGLEEDISQFVSNLEVKLNEGDGIVLYTDGITEARNQEKDFYSVDRLCAIIEAQWQQPAQAILDSIIKDVSEHIGNDVLQDDITLLVIKQR